MKNKKYRRHIMPTKKRKSMRGTGFLDSAIGFAKDHKLLSKGASMIPVIGGPLGGLLNMFGFSKHYKG